MSTQTTPAAPVRLERPEIRSTGLLRQSLVIAGRNLIHIKRMPEMLMDVTVQPVMFVLLFAFVFGGSISVPAPARLPRVAAARDHGADDHVRVVHRRGRTTADIDKGIVDRMRSLPIIPRAVLVGRSISSLMHSSIGILVMSLTGLVIGWRIRNSVLDALLGYVLLLLWGIAMIWVGILVGSAMRSVEAVNGLMFTTMFPITFLANTFAPTERMVPWLRTIAEWNPVSRLVQAVRELWGNGPPAPADAALPLQYPVLATLIWTVAHDRGPRAAGAARLQPAYPAVTRAGTRPASGPGRCGPWPRRPDRSRVATPVNDPTQEWPCASEYSPEAATAPDSTPSSGRSSARACRATASSSSATATAGRARSRA